MKLRGALAWLLPLCFVGTSPVILGERVKSEPLHVHQEIRSFLERHPVIGFCDVPSATGSVSSSMIPIITTPPAVFCFSDDSLDFQRGDGVLVPIRRATTQSAS